ncbi:MAG: hypothetical protein L7U68_01485 [Flavobacteriaceae bacterium]|nr:hypothetical protein [Flavobacteriaceae bacterium]
MILLTGLRCYNKLLQQLEEMKDYTISPNVMDLIEIIDDPQEAISYLKQHVKEK